MKKVILCLIMSLSLFSSENFKDEYLECTLIKINNDTIEERRAEAINEFQIGVAITKLKIIMSQNVYIYENTTNGIDKYTYKGFNKISEAYYFQNNLYVEIREGYKFEKKKYSCKEASIETQNKLKGIILRMEIFQ